MGVSICSNSHTNGRISDSRSRSSHRSSGAGQPGSEGGCAQRGRIEGDADGDQLESQLTRGAVIRVMSYRIRTITSMQCFSRLAARAREVEHAALPEVALEQPPRGIEYAAKRIKPNGPMRAIVGSRNESGGLIAEERCWDGENEMS